MKTLRWELFSFSLPLKEPLYLLGNEINERKGLILRLYDNFDGELSNDIFGEGEIISLPGLHPESHNLAEKQIRNYLSMENKLRNKFTKSLFSSVNFGLDMAKRTLFKNLQNIVENGKSDKKIIDYSHKNSIKIPVNGLAIGTGSKLEKECKKLFDEGFQTVKIKVGQLTVKEDLERVKLVRKTLGDKIGLILDANRSWSWKEALEFFNSINEYKIEYCEEPLHDIRKIEKLHDLTNIPIALDETIWKSPKPENLPKEGIKAFILKPCILGGWNKTKLWIDYAEKKNIQVVLSSSFESGLGLNWNAYIAASLVKKQLSTGLDTAKWFKKDLMDPPFKIKKGFYVIPEPWPKAKYNYLQYIDNGSFVTSF